jgi:hypothetical protein
VWGDGNGVDGNAGGVVDGVADGGRARARGRFAERLRAERRRRLGIFDKLRLEMRVVHERRELIVEKIIVEGATRLLVE